MVENFIKECLGQATVSLTCRGPLVFVEAGLELVQVSPQIVLLECITEGAHGGQLVQQTPVLLTHNLSIGAIRDQEPVRGNSNQVPTQQLT